MSDPTYKLLSNTHHPVYLKGGQVYKEPRDITERAIEEIKSDYYYLTLIGHKVRLENITLIMPFIGDPIDNVYNNLSEILVSLQRMQEILPLPHHTGQMGSLFSKATELKIQERLPSHDYGMRAKTKEATDTATLILNRRSPQVISHTDLHSQNFLKDDSGTVHIIDWESSIAGLKEMDLASLHGSLIREIRAGFITPTQASCAYHEHIHPLIEDKPAYDAFRALKATRSLSRSYWQGKIEEGDSLILSVNEIMKPYIEQERYRRRRHH